MFCALGMAQFTTTPEALSCPASGARRPFSSGQRTSRRGTPYVSYQPEVDVVILSFVIGPDASSAVTGVVFTHVEFRYTRNLIDDTV